MSRVPLVDVSDSLDRYPLVREVVEDGRFVGGPMVRLFEERWAERVGAGACVAVNSGTDALTLTLRNWARARPHRPAVIIPATSFVATYEAVVNAGLEPMVCDVTNTGLLDLDRARDLMASDILAVIPVHLYGQIVDVGALTREAAGWGIDVLEDACQAHGARYPDTDRTVGSLGTAAWSFMPAKILGAWGDAGAVTFSWGGIGPRRVWELANHGRTAHATHGLPGTNSRMDAVQAAVLLYKLSLDMEAALAHRRRAAWTYADAFDDLPLRLQPDSLGRVWSYYVCWAENETVRDRLRKHLDAAGVDTGFHYPYSLGSVFDDGPYYHTPVADRLAQTTLTLPLHGRPGRWKERVIEAVREFYGG